MPEPTLHFQCRHIFTDGRRCAAKSLRGEALCYYHHTTRGRAARRAQQSPDAFQDRLSTFTLPLPEDRSAIQLAIGEIMLRIAGGELDTKRAGLLLYALQIASSNLPKPTTEPVETVEETIEDPTLGLLAPESEYAKKPHEKTLEEILMAEWDKKDKQEAAARTTTLPTLQAFSSQLTARESSPSPVHPRSKKGILRPSARRPILLFPDPYTLPSCTIKSCPS